ncbi:hypothetical protein [Capnocytophaga canis]|uniref:hypothetical protein n=1 Tax=Capnocytophaga canis TaxID=1848903 RepID=UPI00385A9941
MNKDNLHIQSGMQLPENYFDQFKKKLMNQVELEEYIPNKEAFIVPENYFKKSKQAILKATTKKTKTRTFSFVRYAVASVLVAVALSSVWIYTSHNQKDIIRFSDLTSAEIQGYFSDIYIEDKSYLIVEESEDIHLDNFLVGDIQSFGNIDSYLSEYDYRLDEY